MSTRATSYGRLSPPAGGSCAPCDARRHGTHGGAGSTSVRSRAARRRQPPVYPGRVLLSTPRRIILDCDPGHDDALAILLAQGASEVELAAITTVAGNHPLELTTLNALRVCELAGIRDVPVAAGCASPLLRELVTAPE